MSTDDPLKQTDSLSVHQMIAYYTLVAVHKVLCSKQPNYLAERLPLVHHQRELRGNDGPLISVPGYKLDVSRAGFIYRGGKLFNSLPRTLREQGNPISFKSQVRTWVMRNIQVRPDK